MRLPESGAHRLQLTLNTLDRAIVKASKSADIYLFYP